MKTPTKHGAISLRSSCCLQCLKLHLTCYFRETICFFLLSQNSGLEQFAEFWQVSLCRNFTGRQGILNNKDLKRRAENNMSYADTLLESNSAPTNKPKPTRKVSSPNHHASRGKLLVLGSVVGLVCQVDQVPKFTRKNPGIPAILRTWKLRELESWLSFSVADRVQFWCGCKSPRWDPFILRIRFEMNVWKWGHYSQLWHRHR